MPQSKEQRRALNTESQRRRRALERGRASSDDRDFSKWFDFTTRVLQVELDQAWSTRLADIMVADDANLRRLANRRRKAPRLETTYKIGEALREAGLPWCSGLYALYQHPKHYVEVYAVLDVVGAQANLFPDTFDWLGAADNNRATERHYVDFHRDVLRDADFLMSPILRDARLKDRETRVLVEKTRLLQDAIDSAFRKLVRTAVRDSRVYRIYGFFGGLYRIRTDPSFAPVADWFGEILERERLSLLRPDQREEIETWRKIHAKAAAWHAKVTSEQKT